MSIDYINKYLKNIVKKSGLCSKECFWFNGFNNYCSITDSNITPINKDDIFTDYYRNDLCRKNELNN